MKNLYVFKQFYMYRLKNFNPVNNINYVQELKIKDIKKLLDAENIKIEIRKTSSERKLYLTPTFKKELLKIFDFNIDEDDNRIITKGSCKNKNVDINNIVFIQQINAVIKEILGVGYSSHSFRQGLITEMSSKQINIKIISKFIGHKNVSTTLGYINPSDKQIMDSLIR